MPRQKLGAQEMVDNLHRRASEALNTARRRQIEVCMRNQSFVIEHLWSKLQSLGLSSEEMAKPSARALSAQAAAVQQRKASTSAEKLAKVEKFQQEHEGDEEHTPGVAEIVDLLPDKMANIGDLGIAVLRDKVLPFIEPTVLSSANIRSLKDGVHSSKPGLLKYLEFATGWRLDMAIVGKIRCVNQLKAAAKEQAVRRGRRCVSLRLPASWLEDGVYTISCYKEGAEDGGAQVTIKHRFTLSEVKLGGNIVPQHKCGDDLMVSNNWSETSAQLISKRGGGAVLLFPHFPDQTVETPSLAEPSPFKRAGSEVGTPRPSKRQQQTQSPARSAGASSASGGASAAAAVAPVHRRIKVKSAPDDPPADDMEKMEPPEGSDGDGQEEKQKKTYDESAVLPPPKPEL